MNILLINPIIRTWAYPNIIPMGLAYISPSIIKAGYSLAILDLNGIRQKPLDDRESFSQDFYIEQAIKGHNPDVIGICGIITQYGDIKSIINLCRKIKSEAKIVLGGGISSCLPNFMIRYLDIDVAVEHEGEWIILDILDRWSKKQPLSGLKGIWYREDDDYKYDGARDTIPLGPDGLDGLSWPARNLFDIEGVYKRNPVGHLNWESKWQQGAPEDGRYSLSMIATRGCPYSCDYCYVTYLGFGYRCRDPSDVVNEMEYIADKYNLEYIHFLDDLFMTNYKWALNFFELLRKRKQETGFEITWGATCRTNLVVGDMKRAAKHNRLNMLEQAHEVGMRQVGFGIESCSNVILKNIDKSGQNQDTIAQTVREVRRIFGYIDPSFMIGSPGETRGTVEETVDFCKKHSIDTETVFFTTAYPGTPFWDLALDKGLIGKVTTGKLCEATDDMIENYFLQLGENSEKVRTNFSDELSDEELMELQQWMVDELGAKNIRTAKNKFRSIL